MAINKHLATLQEDHIHHEVLFNALLHPSRTGHHTIIAPDAEQVPYAIQIEYDLHERVFNLDELELHAFHESDDILVFRPNTPTSFMVGDMLVGSHLGSWNDQHDLSSITRKVDTGITFSRVITSVTESEDGKTHVTTRAGHVQEAVTSSRFNLTINGNQDFSALEEDVDGRRLSYCNSACSSHEYFSFQRTNPAEVLKICSGCFEYHKRFALLNMNFDMPYWESNRPNSRRVTPNVPVASGLTCKDCYAYIGANLNLELEFTREYVKHFKLEVDGLISAKLDLNLDYGEFISSTAFTEDIGPIWDKIKEMGAAPGATPTPEGPTSIPIGGYVSLILNNEGNENDLNLYYASRGNAQGSARAVAALSKNLKLGVEINKPSLEKAPVITYIHDYSSSYTPPSLTVGEFTTTGMDIKLALQPKLGMDITGSKFPFNMLTGSKFNRWKRAGGIYWGEIKSFNPHTLLASFCFASPETFLGVSPGLGYQAINSQGTFTKVTKHLGTRSNGANAGNEAGKTLNFRFNYDDFVAESAVVLIKLKNDCWGDDGYTTVTSKRHNFAGSGSFFVDWKIPFNEMFSITRVEADDNYNGGACSKWKWSAKAAIAGDPFAEIAESSDFYLYVNDIESDPIRGIGVTDPNTITTGLSKTFSWKDDYMNYFHHIAEGKQEGEVKKTEKVSERSERVNGLQKFVFNIIPHTKAKHYPRFHSPHTTHHTTRQFNPKSYRLTLGCFTRCAADLGGLGDHAASDRR